MSSYNKAKTPSKLIYCKGPKLEDKILRTMRVISDIVGATLGPGGQPILIERQETGLPSLVTKDGVTVFRSLGFRDAAAHAIMETARDAAVRTASEAGDGTTTATVLAESIVRLINKYCKENPKVSPQKVVRKLESAFRDVIEPTIQELSIQADFGTKAGKGLLKSVATVSANGDVSLANAVMECYELVGDDGAVTITEISGPSKYEVEQVDGYSIGVGMEDCCIRFYTKFVNDPGNQRCVLEKPVFVVYHGRITDIQTIQLLMEKIGSAWQSSNYNHNVVLVATGFSETVLGNLAVNFASNMTINVFPLLAPQSMIKGGQLGFLQDICAVTGAKLFDPMNKPLDTAELTDLGPPHNLPEHCSGVSLFESYRFRSNIVGRADGAVFDEDGRPVGTYADNLFLHIDALQAQIKNPESEYDKILLQERLGKVSGGIAKLKVIGASNGELKEKRDRAEDAVCAVRGAIKHGCLPGGGWIFLKLAHLLQAEEDHILDNVLVPALREPAVRLLHNSGLVDEELDAALGPVEKSAQDDTGKAPLVTYDALKCEHVNPISGGILDSTPAVLEAIRNSISIAALLGTLGGISVYERDLELDRSEAQATQQFLRDAEDDGHVIGSTATDLSLQE